MTFFSVAVNLVSSESRSIIMTAPPAVSYTHLDVYKRQVPSCAGGLGGGIGAHAGHRMAYDARILFRITVGFSASGRLSLGRAFSLFPKAGRASGTGSPAVMRKRMRASYAIQLCIRDRFRSLRVS